MATIRLTLQGKTGGRVRPVILRLRIEDPGVRREGLAGRQHETDGSPTHHDSCTARWQGDLREVERAAAGQEHLRGR
jgi:hypothetical protein